MNKEQTSWWLKRPFPSSHIHSYKGPHGRTMSYVTARDLQRRLDDVVGPWGWQTEMYAVGNRVACCLHIDYDGVWVMKTDGAGDTDIEGDKGSFTDAFKRACVQHGLSRFLYMPKPDGSFVTPEEYDAKVPYPGDE